MGVTTEGPIMDATAKNPIVDVKTKTTKNVKLNLVWTNIIVFTIFHLIALHGLYLFFTGRTKIYTAIFGYIYVLMCQTGLAAGAHRLFSHRSFKAKAPLRFLLVLMNTCVWESSIIMWVRDHRTHHKFTDTNADPHNVNRGIFFSHMGWIMVKRHPDVIEKGKGIDLSDLYADPILRFQHKYYFLLMPVACFIVPVVIPMYFWQETFTNAFCLNFVRYLLILHNSLAINSVAHRYGNKTYDRSIKPTDCLNIAALTLGEGFHNYHHTFPWDYKSAELGTFCFNLPRTVIEFFAKIGWAYDLRTATEEMIKARAIRTGDGSHPIWGWGDKDQKEEDFRTADMSNREHEY